MQNYSTAVQLGQYDVQEAIVELDEVITNKFMMHCFADFYIEIHGCYDIFGFSDPLSDTQRINEYKYVYEQLLKYIFGCQDKILNKEKDYLKSYNEAIKMREKTITSTTERKKLVYQKLRNDWLDDLINGIADMLQLEKQLKSRGGE